MFPFAFGGSRQPAISFVYYCPRCGFTKRYAGAYGKHYCKVCRTRPAPVMRRVDGSARRM